MEKFDLTCPKCSGHMTYDRIKHLASCPYCGYNMIVDEDDIVQIEDEAYAQSKGQLRAQDEANKRRNRGCFILLIPIFIVIMIILGSIAALFIKTISQTDFNDLFADTKLSCFDYDREDKNIISEDTNEKIDLYYNPDVIRNNDLKNETYPVLGISKHITKIKMLM